MLYVVMPFRIVRRGKFEENAGSLDGSAGFCVFKDPPRSCWLRCTAQCESCSSL